MQIFMQTILTSLLPQIQALQSIKVNQKDSFQVIQLNKKKVVLQI